MAGNVLWENQVIEMPDSGKWLQGDGIIDGIHRATSCQQTDKYSH
jgi:hypothetical protein